MSIHNGIPIAAAPARTHVLIVRRRPGGTGDELLPQAAGHRARRSREAPHRARMAGTSLGHLLPGDAELAVPAPGFPTPAPIRKDSWAATPSSGTSRITPRSFDAPVREGTTVTSIRRRTGGGFQVTATARRGAAAYDADEVVVAAGGYHVPSFPRFAERLPEGILQVHSSAYRNPAGLPTGEVLVVGTGQSGCQIAEDLHIAGPARAPGRRQRAAHGSPLPRPRRGRLARRHGLLRHGGRRASAQGTRARQGQPLRHRARRRPRHRPAPARARRNAPLRATARGARRGAAVGRRLASQPRSVRRRRGQHQSQHRQVHRGARLSAPVEARYRPVWEPAVRSGRAAAGPRGITSVVWSTGFRTDYSWLELPVFDGRGYPVHRRGRTAGWPLLLGASLAAHLGLGPILRGWRRRHPPRRAH